MAAFHDTTMMKNCHTVGLAFGKTQGRGSTGVVLPFLTSTYAFDFRKGCAEAEGNIIYLCLTYYDLVKNCLLCQ